jgi:4-aminobutyrate aminotransferase / (S)-3-amino-2-methylpropionate transaminase / 5-aminovalerate transaminase
MEKKFSRIQTGIPGPKTSQLLERRNNIVPRGVANGIPTFAQSADGAIVKMLMEINTLILLEPLVQ